MPLRVFVAMPFETEEGIDFDAIYSGLIRPALEGAGFEVVRAEEEPQPGDIRGDTLQELLLADLVVADLSADTPSVWYELGVRHALRSRGVIHLARANRPGIPFGAHGDHAVRYHIKDGLPDPAFLDSDRMSLAARAQAAIASGHSPVFERLEHLKEPDWRALRVGGAREFRERREAWRRLVEGARRELRPGDLVVLADEVPYRALRAEARRDAGDALFALGQFRFALEQYEKALADHPGELDACRKKALCLVRLQAHSEARAFLDRTLELHPDDAESWGLLGRLEKDRWVQAWRREGASREEKRREAGAEEALLREAIRAYRKAFTLGPNQYDSGVNALTQLCLLEELTGDETQAELRRAMEGGVRWAIQTALGKETPDEGDYRARVSLAEVELLSADTPAVEQAYRNSVAAAGQNGFNLDTSLQRLSILRDLAFRPTQVEAGLGVLERALAKVERPRARQEPRQVFLFSGHMIDAPGRSRPRFPPRQEPIAAAQIARKLDELGAGQGDLALCGGACGGDLLFAEAALARGLRLEVRIPFEEPTFLTHSVSFAGSAWTDRFCTVKNSPGTVLLVMPEELGPLPARVDPYERDNLWQLWTALAWGEEKLRLLCLWDGKGGDGPGGTKHMLDTVQRHGGRVCVLRTGELWQEG